MPTYEYACKACGEHVEVVQSFKDDPLTTCANCGGELRKVFGAIGIAFKGSGFYRTDSRQPPKEAGTKEGTEKAGQGHSGGDSKADAPASKGDGGTTADRTSDSKAAASS